MRKSKFNPTQIAKILKEFDLGISAEEIIRQNGVSSSTFYKWRSKYAGMSSKELKRIKQMYVNLLLDYELAKKIIEEKL